MTFLVRDLAAGVEKLSEGRLVSELSAEAEGLQVKGFAPLKTAGEADIAFVASAGAVKDAVLSKAAVLVIHPDMKPAFEGQARALVTAKNPYAWFAWASQIMEGGVFPDPRAGIDPLACVDASAEVDPTARVEAGAVIEAGAKIGAYAWIGANAFVGASAVIGERTRLFPGAKVGDHCRIGNRVILNMNCAIGGEGFGFAPFEGRWVKIPQVGAVVIGDDCEIGACTTIDRGALEDTVVGEGTKIDDQVQIGHNCRIGRHCVICGCVGIAGSTEVGDHCILGGAAMINGHISIPAGSSVGPATPIMQWTGDKADVVTGIFPSQSHRTWEKTAALIRRLPDMRRTLRELSSEVKKLQS